MQTADTINIEHDDYTIMLPVWEMCRDAVAGQRAVKARKRRYLKPLTGQLEDEYEAYLDRAYYFNATGRTVEGMRGLAFRKPGVSDIPETMAPWLRDITNTGKSLDGLCRELFTDTITVGRYGILADQPIAPVLNEGVKLTIAQAQALGLRPYIANYTAENIRFWKYERIGNSYKLANVILAEIYVDADGKKQTQYRELTLISGYYEQIIWRMGEQSKWFEYNRFTPLKNNIPLDIIPFWFIGPSETNGDICNPPIEDLVYVNFAHYKNSADLENGCHLSGLPTPYVTGVSESDLGKDALGQPRKLQLGSTSALLLPDVNSKAGFMQVGADGFTSLEKAMDRKEQQMAALGARLIAPEKKAVETAEAASIKRGGESSVLRDIIATIEKPVQEALKFIAEWYGIKEKVVFEFNKDVVPFNMTAQDLKVWVETVQAGKISERTFFEGLQYADLVADTLTFEEEQDRKNEQGPPLGTIGEDDADDQ